MTWVLVEAVGEVLAQPGISLRGNEVLPVYVRCDKLGDLFDGEEKSETEGGRPSFYVFPVLPFAQPPSAIAGGCAAALVVWMDGESSADNKSQGCGS